MCKMYQTCGAAAHQAKSSRPLLESGGFNGCSYYVAGINVPRVELVRIQIEVLLLEICIELSRLPSFYYQI